MYVQCSCPQSYFSALIYRLRKDGQLRWLLACGSDQGIQIQTSRPYKIWKTMPWPLSHTTIKLCICDFQAFRQYSLKVLLPFSTIIAWRRRKTLLSYWRFLWMKVGALSFKLGQKSRMLFHSYARDLKFFQQIPNEICSIIPLSFVDNTALFNPTSSTTIFFKSMNSS